jgi:23S rRNA (uracil1939-C5)-methyltransferase
VPGVLRDVLRVAPERFIAGGETLARDADGRVVFVRGGVPGDDVTVEIVEHKGDWSRGVVVEVHEPSPDRVEPPCVHRREGCGGCDWQHIAIAAQLPAKVAVVVDALRRTAKLTDADVRTGGSVPASGYRTTIRVVGDEAGRAAFRIERSNDTVSASGCLISHPALVTLIDQVELTPGLELTLRVSAATGELNALWDAADGDVSGLPPSVATGARAMLIEEVAGHRFQVTATSFFQSGPAAAELLVDAVRRAAPELDAATTVLDAYAGVGLFARAATHRDSKLVTVETTSSAVDDCRVNLRSRAARVERGEVGRWRPAAGERFGVVIADPARTGLGRPGAGAIVSAGAPVIALVSCDPVALARDVTLLAQAGYRHVTTEVLDAFPHTHHVETVTRFVLAD